MKFRVIVQMSEYSEKSYEVEADTAKHAEAVAVARAEKEVSNDDPVDWKDLGTDFEVYADIEPVK